MNKIEKLFDSLLKEMLYANYYNKDFNKSVKYAQLITCVSEIKDDTLKLLEDKEDAKNKTTNNK